MKTIVSALIFTLVIGGMFTTTSWASKDISADFSKEEFPPVFVYQKMEPSLVSIESITLPYAGISVTSPFQRAVRRVGGTGFLITEDGYILTYPETISDAEIVNVTIQDETFRATLECQDGYYQLSLLKIWWPEPDDPLYDEYPARREFTPIDWGDSDTVNRGDPVIVMGNPVGLDNTMTYGYCSNIRDIRMEGPNYWDGILVIDSIVIDASINPDNYGGPVMNRDGQVIGIVNRKTGRAQNINYALPSNLMLDVATQLIENGKVFHPWFGIFPYSSYDKELAVYMGIPIDEINPDTGEPYEIVGVLVEDVAGTSPASKIGIDYGDLILRIDGELIIDIKHLEETILNMIPDQVFQVTIIRSNEIYNKKTRIQDKEEFYANITGRVSI